MMTLEYETPLDGAAPQISVPDVGRFNAAGRS